MFKNNKFIPNIFLIATFFSIQTHNSIKKEVVTTTTIEQRIEIKKIEPSLAQKIRAFVVDNKPIFVVGAFIVSILALYPHRAPIFIEWMLIHLTAQMLGGKTNTHLLFHFH